MAPASAGVFFVLSGWEGGIRAFFWEKKAEQKRLIGDVDWVR